MVLLLDMISSLLLGAAEVNSKTPTEAYPERINIIKEISHFKSQITETIKENLKGLTSEKNDNNLNINILYQTVLQETYQQADNLKHLIRAFYRLINVS